MLFSGNLSNDIFRRVISTYFMYAAVLHFLYLSFGWGLLGWNGLLQWSRYKKRWFLRPNTKLFAVKFRRILELSPFKLHKKGSGRIFPIYASKNEVICREVQTHSGCSLPASLKEKVVGAVPRFVRPKTKLRKFWTNFHDWCVQKWSCLLWGSDAFCKIGKKVVGTFSRFMCGAKKRSWLQYFVKMLWPRFMILHAHKSLLGYSGALWSSWLSHFARVLWICTHLDCECIHKLWCASVTSCEAISK